MTEGRKEELDALHHGGYAARMMREAFLPLARACDDLERLGVQPDAVRAIKVVLGFQDSVIHMNQALLKDSIPKVVNDGS